MFTFDYNLYYRLSGACVHAHRFAHTRCCNWNHM